MMTRRSGQLESRPAGSHRISVEVTLLVFAGLVAAMATMFAQLRASLDTPSCRECPHCREQARQERAREERELLRLEDRVAEYQNPKGKDQTRSDR